MKNSTFAKYFAPTLAVLCVLLFAVCVASGQNTNVMPPLNSVLPFPAMPSSSASANPAALGEAGNALLGFFNDAKPYFGTNSSLVYDTLAIYNSGHVGGVFALHIPISALNTNGQIAAGAAIGYINKQWFSLALNAQAGTTWKVPVLGNVYTALGSGPDMNFHTHQTGAFSYFTATKGWDISKGHVLSIVAGVANESTLTGIIYIGGLSLGW